MCNRNDISCNFNSNVHFENKRIIRAAGTISLVTLFSRISGYARDMIFASFFGTGMISDAFIAAFRIPNLLRCLLGEGSLSLAFVPVFTRYISKGDKEDAYNLAISSLKILLVISILVSFIGIVLTPFFLPFMTPGFSEIVGKMELTVKLTRIMFPYIIFAVMVALCMGILNVLNHFFMPAFSPVLLNLCMIIFLWILSLISPSVSDEFLIKGLAFTVLIGGMLQLLLQLPVLFKKGVFFWKKSKIWHPGFIEIGTAMLPMVLGSVAYQVNVLVNTVLASLLADGSVACLYYADRIIQFPLGIFAHAFAMATLPALSRQVSAKKIQNVGETFVNALNFLFFLTIPAMAGILVLGEPIVRALFFRGVFGDVAVQLTSNALFYYATGLWAFAAVRVVIPVFFAFGDTITPVKVAILSMVLNVCFGIVLMRYMEHSGLALATSISSIVNFLLLVHALSKKINNIPWKVVVGSILKTLACAIFMSSFVLAFRYFLVLDMLDNQFYFMMALFLSIVVGVLVFGLFAFVMKMPQLSQIVNLLAKTGVKSD